eukprot:TRINITY_DN28564_c0_g1_i2.p1 TRINITY_DN28564_c0_g1~~TRINITY_DN28564_c0_g1_i2.p1  ORF type:complete len:539 (-),score=1.02 TRINITY_DN28564_c0_g1_i2:178-1794(-)
MDRSSINSKTSTDRVRSLLVSAITIVLVFAVSHHQTCEAANLGSSQETFLLSLKPYLNDFWYESWVAGKDCQTWKDIKCDSSGLVTHIELNGWETGPILSTISALSALRHLEISGTNVTGSIPTTTGSLTRLTEIRIRSSQGGCEGPIPEALSKLTDLVSLDFFGHRFSGGIPGAALKTLTRLTALSLNLNTLTGGIPPEIGGLTKLQSVWLAHNQLAGNLPSQLSKLRLLTELVVEDNRLTGPFPAALTSLTSLSILEISYNPIGGSIPYRLFRKLPSLVSLAMSNANLSGGTAELAQLFRHPRLATIDLSENQLAGSLPANALGQMAAIQSLDLQGNRLSGWIPGVAFANKPALTDLSLRDNKFQGVFPWAELFKATALESLRLEGNAFVGPILEKALSKLRLQTLGLAGNYFSGSLPRVGRGDGDMQFDFGSNYFWGNPMMSISGVPLCPSEGGQGGGLGDDEFFVAANNCLIKTATCPEGNQRSESACERFCGTTSTSGPCSGHGVCVPNGSEFKCICNKGYRLKAGNNHECVR